MISALLDTDTVIALLRGGENVARQARARPVRSLAISAVTLYELEVGVEKSREREKNRRALNDAMAPFAIAPFEDAAALEAARLRAILEKRGKGIGPYETLMAGQALSLGVTLVTANTREFARVPGLKLENWLT